VPGTYAGPNENSSDLLRCRAGGNCRMFCSLGLASAGQKRVLTGTGDAVPCRFRLVARAQPRRSGGARLCHLRWRLYRIIPTLALGRRRPSSGSMGCHRSRHLSCRCRYYPLGSARGLNYGLNAAPSLRIIHGCHFQVINHCLTSTPCNPACRMHESYLPPCFDSCVDLWCRRCAERFAGGGIRHGDRTDGC